MFVGTLDGRLIALDAGTGEVVWETLTIDPETGRPVEISEARHPEGTALVYPSAHGGHNWHPMAYNPATRHVYIPAIEMAFPYARKPDFEYRPGR